MNKPPIEKVLQVLAIKKQITDLYEQQDKLIAELHKEFGAGRFDYDLGEAPIVTSEIVYDQMFNDTFIEIKAINQTDRIIQELRENGAYLKFEIIDNLEQLASGQAIFKTTAVSPLSFASGSLKRMPKSLVETEQTDAAEND